MAQRAVTTALTQSRADAEAQRPHQVFSQCLGASVPRRPGCCHVGWCLAVAMLVATVACDGRGASPPPTGSTSSPAPRSEAGRERPRIVALGDSLTAGLGLAVEDAYPAVLQRKLDESGYDYEVVNAGVSGDTTAGGLRRAEWALTGDVRVLVVALGGNDGLRGLPVESTRENLEQIIDLAEKRHVRVVLAGMQAPTNYGRDYVVSFRNVFPDLAKRHRLAIVPFLLDGVAGDPRLNQPDGIHPTAEGARIVADNVWRVLKPTLGPRAPHD